MTRGALVAAQAEQWIDVPFVPQGRVRAGCDCKGLPAGVAAELGFPEAASLEALAGDYDLRKGVDWRRLKQGLARLFDRVADRQPGDLLLVRLFDKPQHIAIAAPRQNAPHRAIEAMPHIGRVRPLDWLPHRIDTIWRWREVEAPCLPIASLREAG